MVRGTGYEGSPLTTPQLCPFKHLQDEMESGSGTYATVVALALIGAPDHGLTVCCKLPPPPTGFPLNDSPACS